MAISALSLPRKLVGGETAIHARRPEAWGILSEADAAMLDFLRRGGRTSELAPAETVSRTVALLSEGGRYGRLLKVSASEPPRVRAILGAAGEQIGKNRAALTSPGIPQSFLEIRLWRAIRNAARPPLASEGASRVKLFEHRDFEQAILQASERFREQGLRPAIIEKDYYVTEALRAIGAAAGSVTSTTSDSAVANNIIIFKGGTSLSKGWDPIQRFS